MQNNPEQPVYQSSGGSDHGGTNAFVLLLGGIGIGALLMYLLDPDRGRGRRSRLADQLTSKVNDLGEAAEGRARDLRNRAKGVMHEVSSMLPGGSNKSDQAETTQARAANASA